MKRRLHAASVKVVKRRLYTEEVRENLDQIDDELEVFELADHDQHLDKDDSSIYLEVEESRNNFSSSSNDNELNLSDNELDNNCNVNFEQDMEAETINNTDAEFAINIQDQFLFRIEHLVLLLIDSLLSLKCRNCGSVSKPKDQLILNYMQELSAKMDWHNIGISQILHELFPNENDFDRPEGFPSLPLETEESFADFDGHLHNKVLYNHMLKYLLRKGKGETTALFTYSILSTLIKNNLARLISWKGSGGIKLSFEKSKLKNLVESVCLKKFPNIQIFIFEDHMKRWFNTSMQRLY
ncbi:hypothetical protein CAJAP_01241 [Camponotus japonicus]